jgi:Protein of unknown function (DUF1501)
MQRRSFLQFGASGLGALFLSDLGERRAAADEGAKSKPPPRADAAIVLWLNGGPSHVDTFDPKPGSKGGGPFRAIKTRAPGVELCEHLPQLAAEAHRLAILRGMVSPEGNHQRARFLGHTGYSPNPTVEHPALGAWVGARRPSPGVDLPSFVAVSGPAAGGGFLGVEHAPFVVPDPAAPPVNVHLARRVGAPRFEQRQGALAFLEDRFAATADDPKVPARRAVYGAATSLMRSPRLGAFDISSEPAAARKAYGESDFGKGCLLARRLVESGVRYVEVALDGWDTHKDNFTRTKELLGILDPAVAALLRDLDARHLLDRTVVAVMGEFGRSPAINPNEGRDHHPGAYSVLLAGGGVRGGVVHGRTDPDGAAVVEGKTRVADLFATVGTLLGLDPDETVNTRSGRPLSVTDAGRPIRPIML